MRQIRVCVAFCFLSLLLGSPVLAQGETRSTELTRFNGTYRDLATSIEPVRQGGLEIQISSPRHRFTIHGNRVELTPTDRGTFEIAFEAEFDGEGDLIAEIGSSSGPATSFSDEVSARRQWARATAEVTLSKHALGFQFTVVEPGPPAQLEIESALVRQVVSLCGVFALMPMMDLDCEGLGEAMARVRVPLPKAGAEFVLPAEYLTEGEQEFFAGLVASTRG